MLLAFCQTKLCLVDDYFAHCRKFYELVVSCPQEISGQVIIGFSIQRSRETNNKNNNLIKHIKLVICNLWQKISFYLKDFLISPTLRFSSHSFFDYLSGSSHPLWDSTWSEIKPHLSNRNFYKICQHIHVQSLLSSLDFLNYFYIQTSLFSECSLSTGGLGRL